MELVQHHFLNKFKCLADACPDTCCFGWDMQVDAVTEARYHTEAPELLPALASSQADETIKVMQRDEKTGYCKQYCHGLCTVHLKKGESFLGDACYFYPRITRKLDTKIFVTATLSCPEITRIALYVAPEEPWHLQEITRLPQTIKTYLPEGLSLEGAQALMALFQHYVRDSNLSAETLMAHLFSVSRSLQALPSSDWLVATEFLLPSVGERLLTAEHDPLDPYRLLHAMMLLLTSSTHSHHPRLIASLERLASYLGATLNWDTQDILCPEDAAHRKEVVAGTSGYDPAVLQPLLRRWLEAQLTTHLFPFAGLGNNLQERTLLLAVRFATLKWLWRAHIEAQTLPPEAAIATTQSLARFLDHLADPTLSLLIYHEAGWHTESRLMGLIYS